MENTLEYWKKRCLLAEDVLEEIDFDEHDDFELKSANKKYQKFIADNKEPISGDGGNVIGLEKSIDNILKDTIDKYYHLSYNQRFYIIKAFHIYTDRLIITIRSEMATKLPPVSICDKKNTKKFAEWKGFGNAMAAFDNAILKLKGE